MQEVELLSLSVLKSLLVQFCLLDSLSINSPVKPPPSDFPGKASGLDEK